MTHRIRPVLVIIGMTIGCREQVTDPAMNLPTSLSTSRGPNLSVVSLVVTVSNSDAAGNSYGIQNDGKGPYTNGTQNVEAVLDQYGTFAFNTNTSHRAATRWVTYDFSHPVDPTNTYRPSPSNTENYHFSTGASAFNAFIPIQNLGVGGNPVS